jgi:hypothetical protein
VEIAAGSSRPAAMDTAWEILRGVPRGDRHARQHAPREQVVASAMNALWTGFDRARGDRGSAEQLD